jgi:hypothetical protein
MVQKEESFRKKLGIGFLSISMKIERSIIQRILITGPVEMSSLFLSSVSARCLEIHSSMEDNKYHLMERIALEFLAEIEKSGKVIDEIDLVKLDETGKLLNLWFLPDVQMQSVNLKIP